MKIDPKINVYIAWYELIYVNSLFHLNRKERERVGEWIQREKEQKR